MSKLIIEEPPLQVLPNLAVKIGLNEAIVLQQLHYLLRNPKFGRRVAEHQWIFNTYEEWRCQYFPFWHTNTIRNVFASLAKQKLVVFCQPEGRVSRRKYYRINTEQLARISEAPNLGDSNTQILAHGSAKVERFLVAKTTSETSEAKTTVSKESEATSLRDAAHFSAVWKPISGTKAEQLRRIDPQLFDYPDEEEFNEYLENEGMDDLLCGKGGDIYARMSDTKWHQWKERRWVPIRDWKAYVRGLNTKIEAATTGGF